MAFRIPSEARITAVELIPVKPGQINHEPLSGADPIVFSRDPGRWDGRIAIGQFGRGDEADGAMVSAWLSSLDGAAAVVEIKIYQEVVPVVGVVTVASVALVGSYVEIVPSSAVAGVAAGQFVRINNRMFQVGEVDAGNNPPALRLWPPAVGDVAVGDALVRGVWMRIRRRGDPQGLLRRPSFFGPWQLNFRESPGA